MGECNGFCPGEYAGGATTLSPPPADCFTPGRGCSVDTETHLATRFSLPNPAACQAG